MRLGPFGRRDAEFRLSLNNPTVPLSSDGVLAVLGVGMTTDSGVQVNEMLALKVATVWRCVQIISGTIAQLPLRVYQKGDNDERMPIDSPELLLNPYPGMTSFEFWEVLLVHLLLWGNAYVLKVPNELGDKIVRLLPLPPWKVAVWRAQEENTTNPGIKQYRVLNSGTEHLPALTDDEVMHIPGMSYDGIRGLSPVAHARQSLGLAIAAEEFGARLFGSGSMMGGVLTTEQKLTQDQADKMKVQWRERITGLSRAHEIAILDAGLKFTPIAIPPEDAQFLQTRQFSVLEVTRLYGVPPHLVNEVDKSTSWGTGIAEQSLAFVRYTLGGWMRRIEQRATMHLLPAGQGQFAEFWAEAILRGDPAQRYAAWSVAIHDGWLSRNEIRRYENLPPGGPELDVYATPVAATMPAPLPYGGKDPKGV